MWEAHTASKMCTYLLPASLTRPSALTPLCVCVRSLAHGTPDAVFPNNWFSTHPAGEALGGVQQDTLVFYPMKCPNRCARDKCSAAASV